jgi:hypothetical protein
MKENLLNTQKLRTRVTATILFLTFAVALVTEAATITKPNTFSSGTAISSSQVNGDFDALYTEINAKEARLTTIEANQWVTQARIAAGSVTGSAVESTNLNIFLGSNAGAAIAGGTSNTFLGDSAGMADTTGGNNTFIGEASGAANTTGMANSFIGFGSGSQNKTGNYNVFVGGFAGEVNVSGTENTFVGEQAGQANTAGSYNTIAGQLAGGANTTGASNVFFGHNAGLLNTTGGSNSFLGTGAGYANTTGSSNVIVGEMSGSYLTTGSNNTIIGSQAGAGNITGSGNVFIGNSAGTGETGSNKLYIANSGTFPPSAPLIYGDFSAVRVGINTLSPGYTLDVQGGDINASGSVRAAGVVLTSDERLKEHIVPIEDSLNKILKLNGVSFFWKNRKSDPNIQVGFVAQDVEHILPEVVSTGRNGMKSLSYSGIVANLVEAVKQQQTQITTLQAENVEMKEYLCAKEHSLPFCR